MKKSKHQISTSKSTRKVIKKNKKYNSVRPLKKKQTHSELKKKFLLQTEELQGRKDQLREGADRQQKSDEDVHIRSKAMEATADGIFVIDSQKVNFPVIYANQSFQTMTGYGKREIINQDYFVLYGLDADPRIVEEIKSTMQQGKPFQGEMLNFQKNGKKYWNLLRIMPVRDTKGKVTHYVGIQTDVTLIRQRDLEIKEQREQILHVTRVGKLAEFVSSLAHEISQPLTAILAYAQAAQRLLGDREPQVKEILQYIVNDDQRAAAVIRRLRSLLKKNKPVFEPLDVNALIHETIVLISTDAAVRNKIVKTELDKSLRGIRGDRIQLQQVLLNLISNSLEAMEGRDDSRELLIRSSMKDSELVMIEVKDSGCGIAEENMEKLFTQFFTSKPDGLGMGLSISRSIVESHAGRLDGKNNPEGGATFYFTLPLDIKAAL